MPILGERFYQMSNAISCYDLKRSHWRFTVTWSAAPVGRICAGPASRPSHCSCSENVARDAVRQLVDRGFIRKAATNKLMRRDGSWRQSNNHYYILPLPALSTAGHRASRKSTTGDVVEEVYQQNKG